jgi:hypothetical protein
MTKTEQVLVIPRSVVEKVGMFHGLVLDFVPQTLSEQDQAALARRPGSGEADS